MKSLRPALIALLLLAGCDAKGGNFSDLKRETQVLAVVSLFAGDATPQRDQGTGCGYAYEAHVMSALKGAREGELIKFRSMQPLTLSGTYLIFLSDNTLSKDKERGIGLDIRSPKCNESGIRQTVVRYFPKEGIDWGIEVLFEGRTNLGDGSATTNDGRFFAGHRTLADLFVNFEVYEITISRQYMVSDEIAIESQAMLDYLSDISGL
jgi:hypothetical protein